MTLVTRGRAAGILAISLLMLSSLSVPWALALTPYYQPDAQIRRASDNFYLGDDFYNQNALAQGAANSGVVGQKLTFFILVENESGLVDRFKVKRSGLFREGYRVRYYDAAGTDVTGKVNAGSFTTPELDPFGAEDYVLRATVRIRPQATACSFVTRLMTVTSVNNSFAKDAVRFTASRAPNCPPVAGDDANSITEDAIPGTATGNVLTNDADPDGDTPMITSFPAGCLYCSVLILSGDGSYVYQLDNTNPLVMALNDGDTLVDELTFQIGDGNGGTDTSKLTITIHGVTDNACVRHGGVC